MTCLLGTFILLKSLFKRRPRGVITRGLTMGLTLTISLVISGCSTPTRQQANTPPPGPTYRGPDYLRGTVGSLTQLRNDRPLLVSGYGLVVGLHGTGSNQVPAFLRGFMLNEMRKRGFTAPAQVLADPNTAVVAVRGLIPPAAVADTRFDVIVSALSGTQTTSLAGGRLYTTDLSVDGTAPSLPYAPTMATAHGSIYVKPNDQHHAATQGAGTQPTLNVSAANSSDFIYNAVVLSGGQVTHSRELALALNQPSWTRSKDIADRINERFPMPPGSNYQTADATNELIIQLHIPDTYANDPGRLVALIQHLFVQEGGSFAPHKAGQLLAEAEKHPATAHDVTLACQALGRTVIPVLRDHYADPNMTVRMAALQAGARLGDERASQFLSDVADSGNPKIRTQVAQALVHLPQNLGGARTLRHLLDDRDVAVRLAAYQALAQINDSSVDRVAVRDSQGDLKYVIDRVSAKRPLIYITQQTIPRIVIFKPELGFNTPMFESFWNGRLMMRQKTQSSPLSLFYQRPLSAIPPKASQSQRQQMLQGHKYDLQPTVATLAYMLGHYPTANAPHGLNLSYSHVVNVLYHLCHDGAIAAPIKVHVSPLVKLVYQARNRVNQRPVVGPGNVPISSLGHKYTVPAAGATASPANDSNHPRKGGLKMQPVPEPSPRHGPQTNP